MAGLIGQRLGQYEIIALLGEGGMAAVYRARQESVKRDVAIKIIESKLARSPEFIKRFEREARTIAALNHPHILKLFDYGQQGDLLYLVMELQPGGSLADLVGKGSLSLERASRLLEQIASALDYAHEHSIIHRDLKPQNVLLDEKGNAILTDFGVAKVLNETSALTASGLAMGTPAYMAPEQWQALPLDMRADIYALGIMLFEMLSGKLPFNADTPFGMMHLHINQQPPPVRAFRPELPPPVEAVLNKALAKDPTQRFQSAGDLAQAFKIALTGRIPPGVEASPLHRADVDVTAPRSAQPVKPSSRRGGRSGWLAVGAIVLVALIGALAIVLSLSGQLTNPASTSTASATVFVAVLPTRTAASSVTPSAVFSATPSVTYTLPPTATPVPPSKTPPPTATVTPPVPTATPTVPSAIPTTTPNLETLIAATFTQEYTLTLVFIASYTRTPTPTATMTPNLQQTLQAAVVATKTAHAIASFTKTPTLTDTPTFTRTPTYTPTVTPFPTVTANAQWKPRLRIFDGVAMLLVPPGCFMMGESGEAGKQCFEKPFWIDEYVVTNSQFAQFGGTAANPSRWTGDNRPREEITWFEARDFCTKRGARLPTEAEWEYAARGPDGLIYPWGNQFIADNVVYTGNSGGQTADVGSKPGGISWLGALDMSGNVWEWVSTLARPYPYDAADGRESSSNTNDSRSRRGGSWANRDIHVRAAYREWSTPSDKHEYIGFRCARSDAAEGAAGVQATTPAVAAVATVTANAQWRSVEQDFNGVGMVLVPPGCFMMGEKEQGGKQCFDLSFWIDKYEVTNGQFGQLGGQAASPSDWTGENRPRGTITWPEARDFCAERGARLPTEAEWEYAARGPDGRESSNDSSGNRVLRGGSWNRTVDYMSVIFRNENSPSQRWSDYGFRCARSS